jgi:hypothetical protein
VNVLSIFLGNPEPLIISLAPPSWEAEVGDTDVITKSIVVPVTPASTNEYPIFKSCTSGTKLIPASLIFYPFNYSKLHVT